jgi:hypothetical protein
MSAKGAKMDVHLPTLIVLKKRAIGDKPHL